MKKSLLILSIGLFAVSFAKADDLRTSQTQRRQPEPRKIIVEPRNEGAVQRGFRTGNPLQMINPFAPREYGSGDEYVYYDENDPFQHTHPGQQQAKGIRLFGFTF